MIEYKCKDCDGTGLRADNFGADPKCKTCGGSGGWPRRPELMPGPALVAEYMRVKHQRNCAIGLAIALAAWSALSLFLMGKLLERAL
jgi:hypothetical protein